MDLRMISFLFLVVKYWRSDSSTHTGRSMSSTLWKFCFILCFVFYAFSRHFLSQTILHHISRTSEEELTLLWFMSRKRSAFIQVSEFFSQIIDLVGTGNSFCRKNKCSRRNLSFLQLIIMSSIFFFFFWLDKMISARKLGIMYYVIFNLRFW